MRLSRRQVLVAGSLLALPRAAAGDDTAPDVVARWLSGLTPLPGADDAEWRAHAQLEGERWQEARARIKAMQEWSAREIAPLVPADYTLFYPFAGPDALHALALFGGARRIVLVGLEPIGTLPDPARPPAAGYFKRLGAALADVHRLTFFRTQEMAGDFQRDGVLPALVATIVRMGGTVTSVQVSGPKPGAAPTARVDVRVDGVARRIDYVQTDLANAGLAAMPALGASFHALAPCVTFVKAAMYLLAEPRFSTLRQTILDDSALVVQDDTGVPYRHFGEGWALRLFGKYEPPGTPFEDRRQVDLAAAFERRSTPLPFGIGYHVLPKRSNLLLATKGR